MAESTRRPTRQQSAIAREMAGSEEFRSAQEIHAALVAGGDKIGLATVYRTLQSLATDGDLDVVRTDDGESAYRRCESTQHHHHLVCRECGRAVEVQGPTVERWAQRVSAEHGFVEVEHTLEIFGRCADCAG
ncbi:transcriptional repressor [Janibacter alkaliphilus]|uniref:Fur family ferric uptake transcriptional regulator n=1 Tax=Janibacter alkaliphilus TaxID=1069963 RepID=A0A852XCI1_9MICO|nr:Fur family ferric uptake transcriptional regulator [Janibacter alkaliphilus]